MKFTKIVDVTDVVDSDASSLAQNQAERETNQQQFQDEDDDGLMNDDDDDDEQNIIQHDIGVLMPESKEIMSDWTCSEIKVDEITSDALDNEEKRHQDLSPAGSTSSIESMDFYKPEADQSEHEQTLSEHVANALRRETKDYPPTARDDVKEE